MPTTKLDWDLALQKYKTQRTFGDAGADGNHLEKANDTEDIYKRLHEDYWKRQERWMRKSKESEKKKLEDKHHPIQKRYPKCALDEHTKKACTRYMSLKDEFEHLKVLRESVRELQGEREATLTYSLAPPKGAPAVLTPIMASQKAALQALGDPRRNEAAIDSLLSTAVSKEIDEFIHVMREARTKQSELLKDFQETNDHEEDFDDVLAEEAIIALDQIAREIHARRANQDAPYKVDELISVAVEEYRNRGMLEDLREKRRQFFVQMNYLRLAMLQQAHQIEIDVGQVLAKHRLQAFHVRGYDPRGVELMCDSEWYRNLGTSTSLRHASRIRTALETILERAKTHLSGEQIFRRKWRSRWFKEEQATAEQLEDPEATTSQTQAPYRPALQAVPMYR